MYETLQLLGLYEIRHSQIGDERVRGISGGQRKRVNIGMELAADPTVLFLGTKGLCPSRAELPLPANPRSWLLVSSLQLLRSERTLTMHDQCLRGLGAPCVCVHPRPDEPTSGLDSSSSMEVCGALKRISELGLVRERAVGGLPCSPILS